MTIYSCSSCCLRPWHHLSISQWALVLPLLQWAVADCLMAVAVCLLQCRIACCAADHLCVSISTPSLTLGPSLSSACNMSADQTRHSNCCSELRLGRGAWHHQHTGQHTIATNTQLRCSNSNSNRLWQLSSAAAALTR